MKRYRTLTKQDYASHQTLDQAEATARSSAAQELSDTQGVTVAQAKIGQAQAALDQARTAAQQVAVKAAQLLSAKADVEAARAALHTAEINLAYTKIQAPQTGYITRRQVNAGDVVEKNQILATLVYGAPWVTANFKETQLTDMRPGQPVTIHVDAYPGVDFRGHVDSIMHGSGSHFSLLPPENATGNYVKVVQRVPVKIVFDEDAATLAEGRPCARPRHVGRAHRRHARRGTTARATARPTHDGEVAERRHECHRRHGPQAHRLSAGTCRAPARNPWAQPQATRWIIAPIVALAAFMEVLDISIANVSLQHIAGSLGASQDEATWVLTSYLVTNAIVLPITGWLSAVFGRKRFYLACILGFGISSFFCGLAPSLGPADPVPRHPGPDRRRAAAGGPGDPGRHLHPRPARHGLRLLRHRRGLRPGHRTDARRLDHRQLQLALDLPDQCAHQHRPLFPHRCDDRGSAPSGRGARAAEGARASRSTIGASPS